MGHGAWGLKASGIGHGAAWGVGMGGYKYGAFDRIEEVLTVWRLEGGQYMEVGVFRDGEAIASPMFPQLSLTVQQILSGEM